MDSSAEQMTLIVTMCVGIFTLIAFIITGSMALFSMMFKKKDDCNTCRSEMIKLIAEKAKADRVQRLEELINKKAESDRVDKLEDIINNFGSSLATMEANIEFIKKALEK